MRLGEVGNPEAAKYERPLEGVRILAAEQMQALPFGTQLLARLGADVVKVEHPRDGESGRGAQPAMTTSDGRSAGATFLRNNLDKRSVGIDLKQPEGRDLFLALVPHFDVVAENFRAGTMTKLGLDYAACAAVHPSVIYASVSGFGNTLESPYDSWAAYAPIVEAMSGIYDYNQKTESDPPRLAPAGALGDISSALFGTIGILAALRHRDRTGEGQYVDVSMLDSMVAMSDMVVNFWSLGLEPRSGPGPLLIIDGFEASDGWFVIQVGREHQFEKLAKLVGKPEWLEDERFATRRGWREYLDSDIRPAIDAWAAGKTKLEVCHAMNAEGLAAGPVYGTPDLIKDPHVRAHNMLVELPRDDGVEQPVLIPGNPVKMSKLAEGPETAPPLVGEHTEAVLRADLGLDDDALARLRESGVIN
jgi:formyl-CoA transferase